MPHTVQLLILGAGWTSTFLIPLLQQSSITYAATSTTGRDDTIEFRFDPNSSDLAPYQRLPSAQNVLITFPLKGAGQSLHLTSQYRKIHGDTNQWIQFGSTSIFKTEGWNDENSAYDTANPRAIAEDELMNCVDGCVLNLSGLYGGSRDPKNWVTRVAKTKDEVRSKKALHLVHGEDVARAVLALLRHFTPGRRWIVSDLRVYDWYDLIQAWAPEVQKRARETLGEEGAAKLDYRKWVGELMAEEGIRALPRDVGRLGRRLDSRAFWTTMGAWPGEGRVR